MKFDNFSGLKYIGKLKNRKSTEIKSSRLGVGFECLDRDMWDKEQAWPVLDDLGVKWARVQSGWARTEEEKGKYDFAWLDEIVDKLIERGVEPWISISYGNPLYCGKVNVAAPGKPEEFMECDKFGVGFPPVYSPEAREGWQNYVRALAEHFKDRVTHYEVWNEPDLLSFWKAQPKAAEYVDLVRLTSEPLKAVFPEAKLIAGAIAWGMTVWSLRWFEDCMKAGMGEHADIITYHGYKSVPERHSTQEIAAFNHIINKYAPGTPYWQGEAGMQSYVPEEAIGSGALSTMKCTEEIQARMLLRRTLLELNNGCSMSSYFQMGDFAHYSSWQSATYHYGLVRLKDGSCKPAYYALQSLCTLLHGALEDACGRTAAHLSVKTDTSDPRATKANTWNANFVRDGKPVHSWWLPESLENELEYKTVDMSMYVDSDLSLPEPVLVDPLTQEVYSVEFGYDKRTCGEEWMFDDPEALGIMHFPSLPVSIDPLILIDRSQIELV